MQRGYLQPFKYITLHMDATEGTETRPQIHDHHTQSLTPEGFVKSDPTEIYTVVSIGNDGLCKVAHAHEVPVGVLFETFDMAFLNPNHPDGKYIGAKVMVQGIAPLSAETDIEAGSMVCWNNLGITKYDTDGTEVGKHPLGIALTEAHIGDVIPVLLKSLPSWAEHTATTS